MKSVEAASRGRRPGQLTGMRGVYLVAAELSRLGFIASPTSRTAQGADILVTDQACQRAYTVQVKTNFAAANSWFVGEHMPVSETHVFVLVDLQSDKSEPEYYVVPSIVIKERTVHEPNGKIFSIYKRDNKRGEKGVYDYKDNWNVFGDSHAEVKVEDSPEIEEESATQN